NCEQRQDAVLSGEVSSMIWKVNLYCWTRFIWIQVITLLISLVSSRDCSAAGVNGQVVVWGPLVYPYENPNTKFLKITAGNDCSLALNCDGRVVEWGENRGLPLEVQSGVREISSGYFSNLALKTNGSVVAWAGANGSAFGLTNLPPGLTNIAAISAGYDHSL